MAGSTIMLRKAFRASVAIAAYTIAKFGADDSSATVAVAGGDAMFGINDELARAAGENADIVIAGLAPVRYGGAVTRGDPLTADATGAAILAAPAAGVNMRIIGFAMMSGVAGDIGLAQIAPGRIQG